MDLQIALLRSILAGERPVTPQDLVQAFNRDVVSARAVSSQQKAVDATMEALETERERLAESVERQRQRNHELESFLPATPPIPNPDRTLSIEKLRPHITTLATKYVAPLGFGEASVVEKILWRLLEVGARGEQLIVPADLPLVKFLVEEGLIETEPAYTGQLRIRLV